MSDRRAFVTQRGQATLIAFGLALVLVTATLAVSLSVADGAFAGATRETSDRRLAAVTAERLTAADNPVTRRANVLAGERVENLTAEQLVDLVPGLTGAAFRVRLGNRTVVERGSPDDGPTVARLVVLARETLRTRTVPADAAVTLPRRTGRLTLGFENASVETVRAGDRVIAHDPDGLAGTTTVRTRRLVTLRLQFVGNGTVRVTSFPTQTRKLRLVVTVDAG